MRIFTHKGNEHSHQRSENFPDEKMAAAITDQMIRELLAAGTTTQQRQHDTARRLFVAWYRKLHIHIRTELQCFSATR
ncbi:hypothetical protein F2P81_014433 [Scophthalmus maximus]|uniref:Uncharacterized protein n=1 Tax=Scophthalmus maximus TaxID=52904 RepID=A0A6A4SME9_SCOMX|nr:hypothetical protein F2P81_014433 [Scophthalmus maximus]